MMSSRRFPLEGLAHRNAASPAVRQAGRIVTYSELDAQVAALAAKLTTGQIVAVASRDRLDYIIGMLAVLRTGGVYLPVDAEAPRERTEYILDDSGATMLVDRGVVTPRGEPRGEVGAPGYVMYTSGTTGLPKGVWVPFAALAEHLATVSARFGLTADDVVLQIARPTVDVSLEQTLAALTVGACLVLPERQLLTPRELLHLLDTERVTVANLSAGYLQEVVTELRDHGGPPQTLRLMVSGSDRLYPATAAAWRELTGVPLLNAYGPTETTVTTTVQDVSQQDVGQSVGIGQALGERYLYVLDEQLQPCPYGTAGELFIGGPLLAWGYLNRAALSAERFVADPFSRLPGARMYRSGDLVRQQSPRAVLEFIGRSDHQVKIRGFRIEPGEVERALAAYPGVTGCLVVARDGSLVAYATGSVPEYGHARQFLAQRLPEYMIPTTLTPLEAFPLTGNGKVDRSALPTPVSPSAVRAEYCAPRTPVEQRIAEVWAEVLGVAAVDTRDNFFHLGGDSLTAVRMIGRVYEDFGAVSPYAIFDAPTLAEFAAAVTGTSATQQSGLTSMGHKSAPLSKFQRGLFFLDHWNACAPTYNVPWVFRFDGPADPDLLRAALEVIVGRHEILRTVFVFGDAHPEQLVRARVILPFTLVDTSADRVEELIADAAAEPFDLEAGPLFRAHVFRSPDRRLTVVLNFHHIIWDEGSLPVLERELQEIYAALAEDRPHRLPELPVQYADYSTWQSSEGIAAEQLDYWRGVLRDVPAESVLPTDNARREMQVGRGAQHHYAIAPETAVAVRELARSEDATPYMVLLAGLALTLQRRSGHTDLVVGAPVSVRNRPELADMIGYFVNLLPLRLRVDPGGSFRALVRHVREVSVGAYRHQEAPFDAIAGAVLDDRLAGRNPLCQIVFELHPWDATRLPIGGTPVSRELHLNAVSRFDLTISVDDRGTDFSGRFEYDCDLFDADAITGLCDAWLATLAEVVRPPVADLSEVRASHTTETAQVRMERLVADTLREVLDAAEVGLDDDFFRIGGTSLAALRATMRFSREIGSRVQPQLVFRARTVRAIAEQLVALAQSGASTTRATAGSGVGQ
ncbi:amino acid adenylation domain-containing protein [Streptacidiphilus sp. MAP12-16]|uniref:condensation domain-containing protein n=1 Tax=Streptacidiphilus sp. MAP12-16 TaxID=3156300 RepID=UPI003511C182